MYYDGLYESSFSAYPKNGFYSQGRLFALLTSQPPRLQGAHIPVDSQFVAFRNGVALFYNRSQKLIMYAATKDCAMKVVRPGITSDIRS